MCKLSTSELWECKEGLCIVLNAISADHQQ